MKNVTITAYVIEDNVSRFFLGKHTNWTDKKDVKNVLIFPGTEEAIELIKKYGIVDCCICKVAYKIDVYNKVKVTILERF